MTARLGLGLAALGRPAYITLGRDRDLGGDRGVAALRDRCHAMLDAAWDGGVRYVDAARSYGLAEEFLGSWLAEHPDRRAELTIGSKWGYAYVGDWRMDAEVHERKEHSVAQLDRQWPETLAALGGPPDVYLVHSVLPDSPALADAALLDRLRELAATGVRVGISTSGPSQGAVLDTARELPDSPFSAVQSTWNPLEPSAGPALARAAGAGWFTVLKETLANGRLTTAAATPALRTAADARAGGSVERLAFAAALSAPFASIALTGAVTPAQLADNLAAAADPSPDARLADIRSLAQTPDDYWADRAALPWT